MQFGFPYVDSLESSAEIGRRCPFFSPRRQPTICGNSRKRLPVEPLLGLFCEFPGNPLLASPDLGRIQELSRKHDFPVLVDDTLGALINVDVLPVADLGVLQPDEILFRRG